VASLGVRVGDASDSVVERLGRSRQVDHEGRRVEHRTGSRRTQRARERSCTQCGDVRGLERIPGANDDGAMARDIGVRLPATFSEPAGVVHNTGGPRTTAHCRKGYVIETCRSGTTLSPGGKRYVGYVFRLLSGTRRRTRSMPTQPR
jgi:hypothetical protein